MLGLHLSPIYSHILLEKSMSDHSLTLKRRTFHALILGCAIVQQVGLAFLRKLKLMFLYLRKNVIFLLKDPQPLPTQRSKMLAVIPHITSEDEASSSRQAAAKVDKLKNTIDGLLTSFAHCELTIVISTLPHRHITAYLPEYQQRCIEVLEAPDCNPMYVGFRAQDELIKRLHEFDWFLFVEDDIVIHDSFCLEKLEKFNQQCGYDNAVLLPNRYEMWEGTKNYIDLTIDSEVGWNKLSEIQIEGIKYAECTNPHSALYCLSKSQLNHWVKSGRKWKYQDVMVGPLESAATFCLLECFRLYKPHPANLHFWEVKHYDTKYSKLYPDPSPYSLSPVRENVQVG
jgi:hypothetical protein